MEVHEQALDKDSFQSLFFKEFHKQGTHECFQIPSTREEGRGWFDFDKKLIEVAMLGCDDFLGTLITAGAIVNETDEYNCTALIKASRYGHFDCVNELLLAGADVNVPDKFGVPTLGHAVDSWNFLNDFGETVSDQDKCVEVLLEAVGAIVNGSRTDTETPLMSAAAFGDNGWVCSLIERGADVNRRDKNGETALMKAAANGNESCLASLLKAGADLHAISNDKSSALDEAAAGIGDECVRKLIEAGANTKDDVNASFLTLMVNNGATSAPTSDVLGKTFRCFQHFLNIGAYINCSNKENALEMHLSYALGLIGKGQTAMLLLAAGEVTDERRKKRILKDYLNQKDQDKFSLKHLSREAVRKQMITAHPHDNLFQAVPKLGIPSTLESYLLYDVSLDDEFEDDDLWDRYLRGELDKDDD